MLQLKENSNVMDSQAQAWQRWPRGGAGRTGVKGSAGTGAIRPLPRSLGWSQEDSTAGLEAAKGKSHTFSSQGKQSVRGDGW